jgi:Domain of unknown function (DUF4183)
MSLIKIKAFSIDSTDSFTFGNANITTTLNGNIANFSGNITSANANLGNLVVANYISGNGSLLTSITGANVTGQVGNALVAGTVYTASQPNITSVGTLTALAVSGTGNIYGANLVSANYFTGTLTTAAQPNITSLGTLTGLTVNGDITSTGNLIVAGTTTYINSTVTDIKDPIIELGAGANGAALSSDDGMDRGSLLHYYTGGATRDGFMGWKNSTAEFTFASNVSTSNNVVTVNTLGKIKAGDANLGNVVTSNYFVGNGSLLTSITGTNVTGNVSYAVTSNWSNVANSVAGTNVSGQVGNALVAGTVYTAAQPNITSVGTLAGVTATGTVNLIGASNVSLGPVGNVHITGGTSGQYLQTDGSGTLSWASISSTVSNISNGTSNVAIAASGGNITLVVGGSTIETISSGGANITGYMTATGNITGANANLGNTVTANYFTGTLTTAAQPNITSVGTLTSLAVTGNISAGNIAGGNLVSANYVSGTLTTAAQTNITSVGTLTSLAVTGNTTTGNLTGANLVSANYFTGTLTTAAQPNITSVGTLSSLSVGGTLSLNAIGNLYIPGGTNGYVIKTDGSGNLSWAASSSGSGNANISGSNTQIFFNDGGSNTLGASSALTFNKGTNTLGATNLTVSGTTNLGAVGNLTITGGSANYILKTDGSGSLSWYNPTYTTVSADDFTGNGVQTAFTLSTTPTNANYTIVSVGGVVQPKTTYTVSGATLTFSSAPPSTAPIEITTINTGITAVSGGGGGGSGLTYQGISANTTLSAGNSYIVNTSSANLTLTLPASSTLGDLIGIIDGTGTAATHALTITGANIMGSSSDMVITTNSAAFQIVYYNSTRGWVLTNV